MKNSLSAKRLRTGRLLTAASLLILGFWLWVLVPSYGYFGDFDFLWLCRISIPLLALSCLTKDSKYAIGFLATAGLIELIWTIDYFSVMAGRPLIGTTSFLFEYGETTVEFVQNMSHLFLIPLALVISYNLHIRKGAKIGILLYGIPLVLLSYSISNLDVDLNCTHNLCFPRPLNISYSLPIMIGYVFVAAFIAEPLVRRWLISQEKKRTAPWRTVVLAILFALAIAGVVIGWKVYTDAPHYRCVSSPHVECERFFMDRLVGSPYLQYSINAPQDTSCRILWKIDGVKFREKVKTSPFKPHQTIYLPPFKTGTRIVSADAVCS